MKFPICSYLYLKIAICLRKLIENKIFIIKLKKCIENVAKKIQLTPIYEITKS